MIQCAPHGRPPRAHHRDPGAERGGGDRRHAAAYARGARYICANSPVRDVDIVVVSDGSSDRTEEIAKSFDDVTVLVFEKNRGYGAAIKCGFEHGRGDLVSFLDADGTCDPKTFADLCRALEEQQADLVLGSRMGPDSEMPLVRTIGNRIFAWILGALSEAHREGHRERHARDPPRRAREPLPAARRPPLHAGDERARAARGQAAPGRGADAVLRAGGAQQALGGEGRHPLPHGDPARRGGPPALAAAAARRRGCSCLATLAVAFQPVTLLAEPRRAARADDLPRDAGLAARHAVGDRGLLGARLRAHGRARAPPRPSPAAA